VRQSLRHHAVVKSQHQHPRARARGLAQMTPSTGPSWERNHHQ
jgi:hypothetical protein